MTRIARAWRTFAGLCRPSWTFADHRGPWRTFADLRGPSRTLADFCVPLCTFVDLWVVGAADIRTQCHSSGEKERVRDVATSNYQKVVLVVNGRPFLYRARLDGHEKVVLVTASD
eukprot:Phypoly_transcript_12484.p1 GENE.Phypoly_transcript_12484~~Phypoly_transcript_12484.p1  ORF type:complete len:115 (-),score=1.45 Phypoly_transcript_12484:613-957(-)